MNLISILKQILQEEKSKRDRCLRIADRKFDKPSAYKSGAVVRCRKGKIWKGIKEEVEHYVYRVDSQKINILNYFDTSDNVTKSIILNLFNSKNRNELIKDLSALEYEEALEIEQELGIPLNEKQKETLHKWFKRSGAPGKEGGWVDCNSPIRKDGNKPCGRKEGEKRAKYPSCRPTPAGCKKKGKGKTWGKTK